MLAELRSLDKGPKALRRFALTVGGVLMAIGAFVAWKVGPVVPSVALLGSGSVLGLFGLLRPAALRIPYLVWMGLALVLGWVMTRVLLTVVYFVVVTPIGLAMRAAGHDPMRRRPDPGVPTYWIPRTVEEDREERLRKYW